MSEQPNPFVNALLVSVIVLAGLGPAGYYGFTILRDTGGAQQAPAQTVFIALKDETIAEIRAAKTAAIDEIKLLRADVAKGAGNNGQAAALTDLTKAVQSLQAEQKTIVQRLTRLDERRTVAAAKPTLPAPVAAPAPRPMMMPEAEVTRTFYFPLGVAKGPKIDTQVANVLPGLTKHAGKRQCRTDVSGFSDTLGNDGANLKLSQRRADYVAARLKAGGIAIGNVQGWGERRLKIHTFDGADNEKNRRVVIEMNCGTPVA